jgi:predicted MFS family arabinose efflux permease
MRRLRFATFSYFLTLGLAIPTVPRYLTGPLHATPSAVGITVATFSVTAILVRPLVAPAAARIPPNLLLATGAVIAGLATGLLSIAHSLAAVSLMRALAGLGDALFYVLATTAVYALTPEERHASAQSRLTALVSAGILLGPIVAETLRPQIGYTRLWLLGGALCALASAAVLRLPLAAASRASHRRVALERSAVLPGVAIAGQTWAFSAFTIFVVLYAAHLGLNNADAPFAILAAIMLTARTVAADIFDRVQPRLLVLTTLVASTAGLLLLALLPNPRVLLAGSALIAISQALAFPALLQLAVQRAGSERRISAVATFTGFFEVGLASAAIALGAALDHFGFTGLYTIAAVVSAAAFTPLLLTRENGSRLRTARDPCERARLRAACRHLEARRSLRDNPPGR